MKTIYLSDIESAESGWIERIKPLLSKDFKICDSFDEYTTLFGDNSNEVADFIVRCITPKMTGFNQIVNLVFDSYEFPDNTIFIMLKTEFGSKFTDKQWATLEEIVDTVVNANGANTFLTLEAAANYINNKIQNENKQTQ